MVRHAHKQWRSRDVVAPEAAVPRRVPIAVGDLAPANGTERDGGGTRPVIRTVAAITNGEAEGKIAEG